MQSRIRLSTFTETNQALIYSIWLKYMFAGCYNRNWNICNQCCVFERQLHFEYNGCVPDCQGRNFEYFIKNNKKGVAIKTIVFFYLTIVFFFNVLIKFRKIRYWGLIYLSKFQTFPQVSTCLCQGSRGKANAGFQFQVCKDAWILQMMLFSCWTNGHL